MASLSFGIFFIRRLGTFRYLLHGKSRLIWRPGFVSVWPRSPHIYAKGANNTNTRTFLRRGRGVAASPSSASLAAAASSSARPPPPPMLHCRCSDVVSCGQGGCEPQRGARTVPGCACVAYRALRGVPNPCCRRHEWRSLHLQQRQRHRLPPSQALGACTAAATRGLRLTPRRLRPAVLRHAAPRPAT